MFVSAWRGKASELHRHLLLEKQRWRVQQIVHVPGRASPLLVIEKYSRPKQLDACCAYVPLLRKIQKRNVVPHLASASISCIFRICILENCSQPAENLKAVCS